mmetsp:Transcript_127108/g.254011  ORF Transcript_127108/g.254011 Transcript_127108/m.254011 type:complete len:175 (-) Transcript_127108:705-1229(-)
MGTVVYCPAGERNSSIVAVVFAFAGDYDATVVVVASGAFASAACAAAVAAFAAFVAFAAVAASTIVVAAAGVGGPATVAPVVCVQGVAAIAVAAVAAAAAAIGAAAFLAVVAEGRMVDSGHWEKKHQLNAAFQTIGLTSKPVARACRQHLAQVLAADFAARSQIAEDPQPGLLD